MYIFQFVIIRKQLLSLRQRQHFAAFTILMNHRINVATPSGFSYSRNYDMFGDQNKMRNYDNRLENRDPYPYPSRYENDAKPSQSKTGYKYTYYKDPSEYHYHSKDRDSLAQDSAIQAQPIDLFGAKRQTNLQPPQLHRSPSFRRKQQKQRQFLDSIDNVIQSHRSKYSNTSLQPPIHETQSEQILFLKQKLIETHQKLLRELQQTNKLTFELQTTQSELEAEQKQNSGLQGQINALKQEINILHEQLDKKAERNQEKYRSLENKVHEQNRRNGQLKDDLQTMRNKMLQTLMVKNNYEQENMNYKSQFGKLEKSFEKCKSELKEKDQHIDYLEKQLDVLRKKYDRCEKECEDRAQQIHQYSHLASQRQKSLVSLQNQLKVERQKNINSISEIGNLQAEHKAVIKRLQEMEDLCQKYKGEVYWHEKNRQTNEKDYKDKLERMTEEFNFLNLRYKEKEKQVQDMKRKPVYEAQKKRKNYEHTKQFVNRLESEQNNISQSRTLRAQSKGSGRGSAPKSPHLRPTARNTTKSPANRNQNPITHQPITHNDSRYHEQKNKYVSMLFQVGELEADLLSYNMQKKKMLAQMDKIDDTKVKTKDMINKRRKLEDQISSQENKIKRVKDELRKMKAL